MYADERASIYYDDKVRFCTEVERFFNRHDFITADSTGNFTIGDDIVGKLKGDTASGTFIINTDYKYFVQTPQQWCNKWNFAMSATGSGQKTTMVVEWQDLLFIKQRRKLIKV